MSEIKPCMNTECACHREGMHTVLDCGYYSEERRVEECPKYRDTAPAAPWTPLSPDEYVPGCMADGDECAHDDLCSAISSKFGNPTDGSLKGHEVMCKYAPCYAPKKKPETKKEKRVIVDIPFKVLEELRRQGHEGLIVKVEVVEGTEEKP